MPSHAVPSLGTGILLVLLSACSAEDRLFKSHEVDSHKEAGSTHISVLAIAPWADYADSLQPKFELTGEAALQKALPTSQLFSNQLLSEINASGLVSLPTISDVQTESTMRESTGGAPEPGTLPAQGVAAGGARTAASLPALQLKQDATQKEPILQYHTALALYQEVQLLNSYVRDAAKRSGYIPYVVRLQLAVLPFARNQPYDVYADIGFFPPTPAKLKRSSGAVDTIPGVADMLPGVPDKFDKATRDKNLGVEVPIIVPLLVTDAAEVSLQSRAAEIIRRLSGALRGQVYNIGASGNLSALRDEIAAALGNDMNALSTVAQLSPNVARVRLGGAYQASSKYAMLPRANTVTLLVLVPKDEGKEKKESASNTPRVLPIVLRTRIRHALEGEPLSDMSKADKKRDSEVFATIEDSIDDVSRYSTDYRSCGDPPHNVTEFLFRLLDEVYASDYPAFLHLYRCNGGGDDEEVEELWLDLNDLEAGYGYSRTEVELPSPVRPRLPERQLALLSDDTSSGTTVRLAGGKSLIADQVGAALVLPAHSTGNPRQLDGQNQSGERRLPAQSVTKSGDDLILTFPSLAAWKLVADKGGNPAIPQGTKIEVSRTDDECSEEKRPRAARTESCFRDYDAAYVAKAKTPDPGFSIISTVRTVAIGEKGIGSYHFALNLSKAKEVLLRGDGVVVNKVDPAQLVGKDYAWQLKNSGLVTVTFDQLTPGQHFKLILTGTEGRKEEIAIEAKKAAVEDKKSDGAK